MFLVGGASAFPLKTVFWVFVPASACSPLGYPVENILGGQGGAKPPPCSCKTYATFRGHSDQVFLAWQKGRISRARIRKVLENY